VEKPKAQYARPKMDAFLASVERRAFRMARTATGSTDEALDIVQDAMVAMVEKYWKKPEEQWKPLFYRIVQNGIRQWFRRAGIRNRWRVWLTGKGRDYENNDNEPMANLVDGDAKSPADLISMGDASRALEVALQKLPARQQQAFLLRESEGLSVAETAIAMKCSNGSVKTHYSRAVRNLRSQLEDHWP
jgi:RNA polymerase sigma-70 factor (ECF subfamily)